MNTKTFLIAAGLLSALIAAGDLSAQARVNPARTSDLSDNDWNAWRTGVVTSEEADKAYLARDFASAAALYEKTIELFQSVQKNNPSWNKKGLADRIQLLNRKLSAAKRRQSEQEKISGSTDSVDRKIAAVNANAVAETAELRLALEAANKQNLRYKESLERAQKTAAQVESLLKEKDAMEKKHSLLLIQYSDLKEKAENREADQALKAAIENEKKRSLALETELQNARQSAENMKKALAEAEAGKAQLTAAADTLKKHVAEIADLKKETAALQQRLQKADRTAADAQNSAKAEIKRLTEALAKKSREADEANEALTAIRSKMDLSETTRLLEQSTANLRKENTLLQNELEQLRKELDQQKKTAASLTESAKQSGAIVNSLSGQNRALAADIERLGKNLAASDAECKKLAAELGETKKAAELLKKERDIFAEQLARTPGDNTVSAVAELEQTKGQVRKLTETNKDLAQKLQKAEEQEKALRTAEENLKVSLRTAEEKLKKTDGEITALLGKVNAASVSEQVITGLKQELGRKDDAIRQADGKAAAADKQTQEVRQQLAAAEKNLADLKVLAANAEKTAAELQQVRTALAALDAENKELKVKTAYYEKKDAEYTKLENNTALLKSVMQENRVLKVELENARSVKPENKISAELEEAKRNLEQYHSRYQQNLEEMNRIKGQQLELRLQLVALEKQLTALRTENAELKKDPASKTALEKAQKAEQEKQALQNKLDENGKRIAGLEKQIRELTEKNSTMIRAEEVLKKENAALKAKAAEHAPVVKALETRISALEKTLGEQEVNAETLKKQGAAQSQAQLKKIQELEKLLSEKEQALAKLKDAKPLPDPKVKELEKLLSEKEQALAKLKDAKPLPDLKVKELEKLLSEKEQALAKLKDAKPLPDPKVKELEKLLSEKEQALAKLKDAAPVSDPKVKDLKKTIAEKDKKISELETIQKNSRAVLEKSLAQAQAQMQAQIQTQVQTQVKTQVAAQLDEQVQEKVKEQTKVLEQTLAQKEQAVRNLEKELKETKGAMDKLKAGVTAAQDEEQKKLRQQIAEAEKTVQTLRQEKTADAAALAAADKEILAVRAQLEKLRTAYAAGSTEKYLNDELNTEKQRTLALSATGDKLKTSVIELNTANQTLLNRNKKLEKDLGAAHQEIAGLREEVRKWKRGSDSVVREKLKTKDLAIDQLLEDYANLQKNLEEQKRSAATAKGEAEASRREARQLRSRLELLQNNAAPAETPVVTTDIRITPEGEIKQKEEPPVFDQKKYETLMAEAAAYEKAGEPDFAMWKYLSAADVAKNHWQPRFAMSRLHLANKNAAKAEREYRAAVALGMKPDAAHEKAIAELGK